MVKRPTTVTVVAWVLVALGGVLLLIGGLRAAFAVVQIMFFPEWGIYLDLISERVPAFAIGPIKFVPQWTPFTDNFLGPSWLFSVAASVTTVVSGVAMLQRIRWGRVRHRRPKGIFRNILAICLLVAAVVYLYVMFSGSLLLASLREWGTLSVLLAFIVIFGAALTISALSLRGALLAQSGEEG